MGFVRKNLGVDITGGGARRAAERAAEGQAVAGEQAIAGIQEAGAPFAQLGVDTSALLQNLLSQQQPQTPVFQAGELPQLQSPEATLTNPFFQALQKEQEQGTLAQRAALGLAGSGGTEDALARQQLLLGNQFQQQDLANQQLGFANRQQIISNQQQDFANRQAQQQNRFNQLFGVTQLGANAAIGQAGQVGNLLTDVAAVRGVGDQARAQQQGRLGGQLLQGIGTVAGSMVGGPAGGYLGGNLFGGSSVGGPVGQQVFGLGNSAGAGGTGALSTFGL